MTSLTSAVHPVHYLPIGTTVLSAIFFGILAARYRARGGTHLWWWAAGVFAYGLGTALESAITLTGNSVALNKAWYVAGALLGGYALAQGTVYLLLPRRTANILTAITVPVLLALAVLVIASPVVISELHSHRPTGAILGWRWIRALTPFINGYAALFLIGGAVVSACQFAQRRETLHRAVGNSLIAAGAILPGVGGGMAKAGFVEYLYVGEFVGLILIWCGYAACVRTPAPDKTKRRPASLVPKYRDTQFPPSIPSLSDGREGDDLVTTVPAQQHPSGD